MEKPRKKFKKIYIILIGSFIVFTIAAANNQDQSPQSTIQNNKPINQPIVPIIQNSNPKSEIVAPVPVKANTGLTNTELSDEDEEENEILKQETPTKQEDNVSQFYQVTQVVDGDTIKINLNGKTETLRLIGINTPETVDPRKPVECFGKEASAKAKELLSGQKVRIESDSSQDTRDKYNRLLAYIYRDNGLFFNKWMVENGFAYEYTYNTPYKYQSEFKAAQTSAEKNKMGLWAPNACDSLNQNSSTPPPATNSSGHIFYTSSYRTSKNYYCDTDLAWKNLSPSYLESFSSEAELLKKYPSKNLNEPCK